MRIGVDLVDTIQGHGRAPSLVLALCKGLPDTSLTVALMNGGREYYGWGVDRHIAADLYDALNQNTRATGMWGKKPPDIPPWPRPGNAQTPEEKKPMSVAELHQKLLSRR